MKIKKNLLLALWIFATLSFAFVSNNFAQQDAKKDVTGKVVDELSGEVLVGVTVKVKATNIATTTNAEGSFVIRATADDVLIFNIMGYVVLEKVIKQSDLGTVKLKPSQKQLEEVLVIGYGQVSKKDVTGAIGEVKMDELTKAPVASFDQALAGRVAGVQVSSGDGQPGSDMNIVIRGGNSLTQTNAPLYVVDGFPIEDFTSAALNPTDIKSISILKDASATAIYGSRAANGVVLIETKTGKTGQPEISYTGLAGLQEVTKTMALMDAYDFVSYQLELNPSLTRTIYFIEGRDINYYKNVNSY
ncbi:TonB-dependent receptor plug domain-containing protein, partial [Pedobacter sp.]